MNREILKAPRTREMQNDRNRNETKNHIPYYHLFREIKVSRKKLCILRFPFTLSGVFSFPYVTPLIRIGYPQTYILYQ